MKKTCCALFLIAFVAFGSSVSYGQNPTNTIGTPPFASFGGGPVDVINLGNLNAHITMPVLHKAGRGLPFNFDLVYDTSIWTPHGINGGSVHWMPSSDWGLGTSELATGYITNTLTTRLACSAADGSYVYEYDYSNWTYHDGSNTPHWAGGISSAWHGFYVLGNTYACAPYVLPATTITEAVIDGSGYTFTATGGGTELTTKDGTFLLVPINPTGAVTSGSLQDRNGNLITVNNGVFKDTVGTTALTVTGAAPNAVKYSYIPPALEATQGTVPVTVTYKQYTVQTQFLCTNPEIVDYGPTPNISLVDRVTYPDGSFYSFTYEQTPGFPQNVTGRLASITVPTGGQITYAYTGSNNGMDCTTATPPVLTRTTPDGTWSYAQIFPFNNHYDHQTQATDPQGNQTLLSFVWGIFEGERDVYQGQISPVNLLQHIETCYNGGATYPPSNCAWLNSLATLGDLTSVNVTSKNVFVRLPSGLQAEHDYQYSIYGMLKEADDYDFGQNKTGPLLKKTIITYASLGNNIHAFRQTVTVQDGSGNNVSTTSYNYDETGRAASGAPSSTHVGYAGPYGNLTSIHYPAGGLTKVFSYDDAGNILKATDVNLAATSYQYGACGSAFQTLVQFPMSTLSNSYTWDCYGGVQETAVDENSHTASVFFNDPYFFRPYLSEDQIGYGTTYTYPSITSVESTLGISGQFAVDVLQTQDSLGRKVLTQKRQSPGSISFDTIQACYDALGRPDATSMPFSAAAGQTNSCSPGVTTSYDALGRVTTVSDAGGGWTSLAYYPNNDVLIISSAPQTERQKQRMLEYNSLGQLTSVCEVTSATGSSECGQGVSMYGFWTRYKYDALGNLIGVCQNTAQPIGIDCIANPTGGQQTRVYQYDAMSRLISANNPETGIVNYVYDTDSYCGTHPGDLVKRTDAVGNTTCYAYDSMHRVTSKTYLGPYAAQTPNKYFVYDSASVGGAQMANAKTRLAEAYTCFAPCTSKLTDLGFGYSARGELTDTYELTPHSASGTYYYLNETYWPNGLLNQMTGNLGMPTLTYGLDGEGRLATVSASSGQNPVTSTAYNVASQPTKVSFGSGDSDVFAYDPNSGRETQYTFNVAGNSMTGSLNWNPNGSLNQLTITDPYSSLGNQTCSYTYDDLARLAAASCGSIWAQTFSYDPFGNISKSGSMSFQPTYSPQTNQISSLPGFTPTYDANGNVLNDASHTYTWDAEGRPVAIDQYGFSYDALGRRAEQAVQACRYVANRRVCYLQYMDFVYDPGAKILALLFPGDSLTGAVFASLPGGATAVYSDFLLTFSTALNSYMHPDWIGSSRLTSSPIGTWMSDTAYAPYGEIYAVDHPNTGDANEYSFAGMLTSKRSPLTVGSGGTGNPTVFSSDTTLYNADAREYSDQGRWPSPDPAGLSTVRPENPQTWNRYSYSLNNPLRLTDPSGLGPDDPNDDPAGCAFIGVSLYGDDGGGCSGGIGPSPCDGTDNSYLCAPLSGVFGESWYAAAPPIPVYGNYPVEFSDQELARQILATPSPFLNAHVAPAPKPWTNPGLCSTVGRGDMTIQGLANSSLAVAKIGTAFGTEVGSEGLSTPFSYYEAYSGFGNGAQALADFYGAVSGNIGRANALADRFAVGSSAIGTLTYVTTGSIEAGLTGANLETGATYAFSKPDLAGAFDAAQSAVWLGCHQ